MNLCLFCGGDARSAEHFKYCDGRQGRIEAQEDELPLLISGIAPETWNTSAAAALSVEERKDTQRAEVRAFIKAAGAEGRTDDEIQEQLHLDGSSERPRRWELWKLGLIDMKRDAQGEVVRRLTRTQRRAVVWVTTGIRQEVAV